MKQPKTRCAPEIFEHGITVCTLAGCSTAIEAIVVRVREQLGVSLDWHFIGGRANILTLEPEDKHEHIRETLRSTMPQWLGP